MNGPLDERSLRKQLLVARSNLHRLEVRKEVLNIVDGLNLSSLGGNGGSGSLRSWLLDLFMRRVASAPVARLLRSEEHTSELQSRRDLVCRLLLEKKKKKK